MISSMCDNAATINSNSNNFIDIPQIPLGSTITNLVVKSMESSVAFYNNVMDMDIVQSSSRCIVLTNGSMTICLTTKEHANDTEERYADAFGHTKLWHSFTRGECYQSVLA